MEEHPVGVVPDPVPDPVPAPKDPDSYWSTDSG